MAAPKIMTCFCCGAEITAPQFHNGKAYGWTCIKKVVPSQKQSKTKFVAVELVGVLEYRTNTDITAKALAEGIRACGYSPLLVIRIQGKKVSMAANAMNTFVQDGTVYVEEPEYEKMHNKVATVAYVHM